MNPTEKKKKANQSIFAEIFWGVAGLFLGDIRSKIGRALLFLIVGITFLIRPVVDPEGTEIKKEIIPCVIGSIFILFSGVLIFSSIRQRNTNKNMKTSKKTLVPACLLFILSSAYGQKSDISKIEETIRMQIDSSWAVCIDTVDIRKDMFDRGILIGVVQFTTKKGDKLNLLLCKSSSDYLFKNGVLNYQNSASCSLSEDIVTHRSILRIENYYLFLPIYPCWSVYSRNAQELMKELVGKMEHY